MDRDLFENRGFSSIYIKLSVSPCKRSKLHVDVFVVFVSQLFFAAHIFHCCRECGIARWRLTSKLKLLALDTICKCQSHHNVGWPQLRKTQPGWHERRCIHAWDRIEILICSLSLAIVQSPFIESSYVLRHSHLIFVWHFSDRSLALARRGELENLWSPQTIFIFLSVHVRAQTFFFYLVSDNGCFCCVYERECATRNSPFARVFTK